jgi:hypothetical protein
MAHKTLASTVTVVMGVFIFASSPAWAAEPVCSTCSYATAWGITDVEIVRVCLVGVVTRPASATTQWKVEVFGPDGETILGKRVRVPQQGFRCVDTTPEELRSAGVVPEVSGRLSFGLRVALEELVPLLGEEQRENITFGGNGSYVNSVETINVHTSDVKKAVALMVWPQGPFHP